MDVPDKLYHSSPRIIGGTWKRESTKSHRIHFSYHHPINKTTKSKTSASMNKDDIYHTLAAYHLTHNLSSLQQLRFTLDANGVVEQKGTVPHPINGALILANGPSLLDRLAQRKYFKATQLGPEVSIATPYSFMAALHTYLSLDGAIIIDSKKETMRHVSRLLPPSTELEQFGDYVRDRLPIDFRVYNSTHQPTEREIGTRTLAALEIPMLEQGVESFMINQTAWGNLGIGKVVRFGQHGILSEMYLAGTKERPLPMERVYESGPKEAPRIHAYQPPQLMRAA